MATVQTVLWRPEINALTVPRSYKIRYVSRDSVGTTGLAAVMAKGCFLGYPEYYRRFGFENAPGLFREGVPPEVFFALFFDGHLPQGEVKIHEAFHAAA